LVYLFSWNMRKMGNME